MSDETTLNQLTLFAGDSHVKTYRWLDAVLDWLENEADSGGSSIELLRNFVHNGLLLKMSPAFCHPMGEETWVPSSGRWGNSGMGGPTQALTLNTLVWRNDASVCSLSDVLETGPVPQKYYLSARAARGILRRAEKRGKELPLRLREALQSVAESMPQDEGERTT